MRPNALFLTPRLPFPLVGGDRVKAFHLLKILSTKYNVTCVSFVEEAPVRHEWIQKISALGVDLHVIPLKPFAAKLRVARSIFSDKPLEVEYYSHHRFQEKVNELVGNKKFDIVFAFFMRTAEYARTLTGMPRVLIAEDARLLTHLRATTALNLSPGYFMSLIEREKLSRYEPSIVNDFDLTTFVSPIDRDLLLQFNPTARTAIITNGVDLDEFAFNPDQSKRSGIVFAGKMDVRHNVPMALRIGRELWPQLRKQFPTLQCRIVGKNPSASVRRLRSLGVTVTGEVPHVRDYISSSAVFLHPQIIGAGIQNKVLEAMALGTPVVTTPVGIAGIRGKHGVHVMIGNSNAELVDLTARLLASPALRSELAQNARELVEADHTWELVATQLFSAIDLVNGLKSRPQVIPLIKEIASA